MKRMALPLKNLAKKLSHKSESEKNTDVHRSIFVISVFSALGLAVAMSEYMDLRTKLIHGFTRGEGEESQQQTLYYRIGKGQENEVTVEIGAREKSTEEIMELLEEGEEEWESIYLGENESQNEIRSDLELVDEVCDGEVSISYSMDSYEAMDVQGQLIAENLSEEGTVVTLTAEFRYDSCSLQESKLLCVYLPEQTIQEEIEEALAEEEESTRSLKIFTLPDTLAGYEIRWSAKISMTFLVFPVLGIVAAVLLRLRSREQKEKRMRERNQKLTEEFPLMVQQMSLLLGSGMTLRHMWERMLHTYTSLRERDRIGRRYYMEEMLLTWREIRDGRNESEAYIRFGQRIGLMPYRRLSSLLSQNLSKGSRDLCKLLEAEAKEAMDERKNRARRLGEEAGSKMLGPMMLMFVIILVLVLFPAAGNMGG